MKRRISAFLCAGVFMAVSASPALAAGGSPGSTFPEQPGSNVENACAAIAANPGQAPLHFSPTAGAILTALLADACTFDWPILGQDWLDTFDDFRAEPVELIEAGEDKVIAVVRISGRAKLSGVETDLTYAELWTLRDGKAAWGRQYWTRDEALQAAGLRE